MCYLTKGGGKPAAIYFTNKQHEMCYIYDRKEKRMENEEIAREHQLIFDLAKSNKRRIDNLEEEQKELRNLTNAVSQMVVEQKNMRDDLAEMKNDVKQIREKPGKRWDGVVDKVIFTIVGASVAYLLAKGGF